MTPDTWQKIKDIFATALEADADRRVDVIEEICGGDLRLKSEVEALLRANDATNELFETPAFRVQDALPPDEERTVRTIGPYRVEREIGRGGMGTVFLARREDGQFRQQVAIKIVSSTLLGNESLRRFRQERQILAGLNHPNIARLLDGGVTDDGISYLVMEHVEGQPLMEFVAARSLSIDERLQLFVKICRALAYAHRNLIVHRDVKPSNILVTADGEPKLLDFGLAKILDIDSDDLQTATNFRALTPAYASPEQLRGDPITTASDIYSLGVVLYELVTNVRPFGNESVTFEKMMRFVTVDEPERPSVRAVRFRQALRGDVDNIVLTAMRKEPDRRYRSVEMFADDIERHLRGLPVTATEDTFVYRSSKFIRRHWIGVASATLVLVVLLGGIAATSWQAKRASEEKALAEATKAFLTRTLNYSNPIRSGRNGSETTVMDVLDEAARRLDSDDFASQPEIRADLELIIGKAYNGQGRNPLALQHIERYVELERSLYGDDHPKTVAALTELAVVMFNKGDLEPARETFARSIPALRVAVVNGQMTPDRLASALNNYACLRRTQGDSHEAEMLFREALDLSPSLSDEDWRIHNGTTRSTLASTLSDQGRFEEALAESQKAVDEATARNEQQEPTFGFTLTVYGGFLTDAGRYDEADARLREAEALIRKYFTPTSLWLGDNLRNQSILAYRRGDYQSSLARAEETLSIYKGTFGTHYDHYPTALIYYGLSLARLGRANEGEEQLREAVRIRTELLPPDHYWLAVAKSALGECLMIEGRYAEAEPLLTESLETLKRTQGETNPKTDLARRRLAALYQSWRKPDMLARAARLR